MTPHARFRWEQGLRASPLRSTAKLVGFVLATYADSDGSSARPGVQQLAVSTSLSDRAVRAGLQELRDAGLIERTVRGSNLGRRAVADVYRLTLPDAGSPAPTAAVPERSPAPTAGDRHGTPAPDDRITGTTFHLPTQDHSIEKYVAKAPTARDARRRCPKRGHEHAIVNQHGCAACRSESLEVST